MTEKGYQFRTIEMLTITHIVCEVMDISWNEAPKQCIMEYVTDP